MLPQQDNPFDIPDDRNILSEWLASKRNKGTRREYKKELRKFFLFVCDSFAAARSADRQLTPTLVMQFLQMERFSAATLILRYKAELIDKGLKEASVNRSIAAIKSLVNYAYEVGQCTWTLADRHLRKLSNPCCD